MMVRVIAVVGLVGVMSLISARGEVVLVQDGQARCAIVASAAELSPTEDNKDGVRLKASIDDLAHYLGKISGATVEIVPDSLPQGDARLPILVGNLATQRFGKPKKSFPDGQAFRIAVTPKAVGLIGESDLGTSYAVYEVLHRLGCRWFMPSDMGEVIPSLKTVALPEQDESLAPYTLYRGIWFADEDYKRRNRQGGLLLNAGHALEGYVTKEQRAAHPEWQAMNNGKHKGRRLKWSAPGVPEALAEGIERVLQKHPEKTSVSLSPDDGLGYDDTDDRKLDTGDFDPSVGDISITDRQVWLCNRVIAIVTKKHPDMLFGMLAYGQSTRPPVREEVDPHLIPQIAPITYRRAHPMTWPGVPDNEALRFAITGWAKKAPRISYYFYGWLLAEPASPNPFITKWSEDIQFVYQHGNCAFWQPETMATFDSSMHALYLGLRMAWDPSQKPADIIHELHEKFYGHAARQMAAYWHYVDRVWVNTPEYSGAGFGHLRRWTPERLEEARRLMDAALGAAETPAEKFRIEMNDKGLRLFELFMKLRRDLADGRFETMGADAERYDSWAQSLAVEYKPQYAFGYASYLERRHKTWYAGYFRSFYKKTYDDAARIEADYDRLPIPVLRKWKYRQDAAGEGESEGWAKRDFNDESWLTTDVCLQTWSTLGMHGYLGAVWYRQNVLVPELPADKKVYLWIGATDGSARLIVNGHHVPYVNDKGESQDEFSGYCKPASFDVSDVLKPGERNQFTILCKRTFINELGTGGLLGAPVVLYRER